MQVSATKVLYYIIAISLLDLKQLMGSTLKTQSKRFLRYMTYVSTIEKL